MHLLNFRLQSCQIMTLFSKINNFFIITLKLFSCKFIYLFLLYYITMTIYKHYKCFSRSALTLFLCIDLDVTALNVALILQTLEEKCLYNNIKLH